MNLKTCALCFLVFAALCGVGYFKFGILFTKPIENATAASVESIVLPPIHTYLYSADAKPDDDIFIQAANSLPRAAGVTVTSVVKNIVTKIDSIRKTISTPAPTSVIVHAPLGDITAITARTATARDKGLSGHEPLKSGEGMIFIFPTADTYEFWMKDMKFSLDFIWIDANKKIIAVTESISPDTYPQTFKAPAPVQFVLEIPAGSAKKLGLKPGVKVSF
jgi:uncharacterized membrane protein (UPF0127 family)